MDARRGPNGGWPDGRPTGPRIDSGYVFLNIHDLRQAGYDDRGQTHTQADGGQTGARRTGDEPDPQLII